MATFRALIKGTKGGTASRLGHQDITAMVNGWNLGVFVHGVRDKHGRVSFEIYKTKGSNGGGIGFELIATIEEPRPHIEED